MYSKSLTSGDEVLQAAGFQIRFIHVRHELRSGLRCGALGKPAIRLVRDICWYLRRLPVRYIGTCATT